MPPRSLDAGALKKVNTLTNNKIVDQSQLKAAADGKINVTQKLNFFF